MWLTYYWLYSPRDKSFARTKSPRIKISRCSPWSDFSPSDNPPFPQTVRAIIRITRNNTFLFLAAFSNSRVYVCNAIAFSSRAIGAACILSPRRKTIVGEKIHWQSRDDDDGQVGWSYRQLLLFSNCYFTRVDKVANNREVTFLSRRDAHEYLSHVDTWTIIVLSSSLHVPDTVAHVYHTCITLGRHKRTRDRAKVQNILYMRGVARLILSLSLWQRNKSITLCAIELLHRKDEIRRAWRVTPRCEHGDILERNNRIIRIWMIRRPGYFFLPSFSLLSARLSHWRIFRRRYSALNLTQSRLSGRKPEIAPAMAQLISLHRKDKSIEIKRMRSSLFDLLRRVRLYDGTIVARDRATVRQLFPT